jgi:hypothetical protein
MAARISNLAFVLDVRCAYDDRFLIPLIGVHLELNTDVRAPVSTFALILLSPSLGKSIHSRHPSRIFIGSFRITNYSVVPLLSRQSGLILVTRFVFDPQQNSSESADHVVKEVIVDNIL